jgi:hypothetical protein
VREEGEVGAWSRASRGGFAKGGEAEKRGEGNTRPWKKESLRLQWRLLDAEDGKEGVNTSEG